MADLLELEHCTLCEHRCGANRVAGETGVCGVSLPAVASAQLHPAPPSSYTVFMAGCNFKCLNCQNWTISCYPVHDAGIRGFVEPRELAAECVEALHSRGARAIGVGLALGYPMPSPSGRIQQLGARLDSSPRVNSHGRLPARRRVLPRFGWDP